MNQNISHAVMQQIISRDQAKILNLKRYFTGILCVNGHLAERQVSNHTCLDCMSENDRRRRAENPEHFRKMEKARRDSNIDLFRKRSVESRNRHLQKRRDADILRYQNNKERYKDNATKWASLNKGKRNSIISARRLRIKQATPVWLTNSDLKAMREFYIIAANLNGDYHVDHIIPINGKTVCGLHVPSNLQILPRIENLSKGNRYVCT